MEKKAIFLDMDGTTLNDLRVVSEGNYHAMERAIKAGHDVVIATGRASSSIVKLLERCNLNHIGIRYVLAFNGAMIVDITTGEVLYKKEMSLDYMKKIAQEARKLNVYIQTYEGECVLTDRDDANLKQYTNKTTMDAKLVSDLVTEIKEPACKMLAIDLEDTGMLEQLKASVESWCGDDLEIYKSCREYLEFVPRGVNKGLALQAFCKDRGIRIENSIAAGDEGNDISMIHDAGIGCAVANALPEVKAAADYITENDNNHDAVREIIEKFML
ncbi:MAG: Cof-type HAD-IIB family hydrolase [Lachnospiraceae bacterium]|nr:Cof-type HAD-IIB family hydrolase [Lachnospiraceae bacterium]